MMFVRAHLRFLALALLAATSAGCGGAALSEPAKVQSRLQAAYPGAAIDSVKPTPIQGVFEVNLGGRMVYSDASGRYLLFGSLQDMQSEAAQADDAPAAQSRADSPPAPENMTALAKAAPRDAIKVVKGNGAGTLYLFSDPKCPYCRPAEAELDKLDNVTVYTFLYPVLSSESRSLSAKVWCSSDRAGAWKKLMRGGGATGSSACATPLDANIDLGRSLGIKATPTLVNSQGRSLAGFQSADNLVRFMSTSEGSK